MCLFIYHRPDTKLYMRCNQYYSYFKVEVSRYMKTHMGKHSQELAYTLMKLPKFIIKAFIHHMSFKSKMKTVSVCVYV